MFCARSSEIKSFRKPPRRFCGVERLLNSASSPLDCGTRKFEHALHDLAGVRKGGRQTKSATKLTTAEGKYIQKYIYYCQFLRNGLVGPSLDERPLEQHLPSPVLLLLASILALKVGALVHIVQVLPQWTLPCSSASVGAARLRLAVVPREVGHRIPCFVHNNCLVAELLVSRPL